MSSLTLDCKLVFLRVKKLLFCVLRPKLWPFASRVCFPSVEHLSVIKKALYSGIDCFYDIGANIGQFSLLLYSTRSNIPVIAFEPIPSCYNQLNQLSRVMPNLVCHNLAIGPSNTSKTLFIASRADSSSFLEPTIAQANIYGITSTNKTIVVDQAPLSCLLQSYPCHSGFLKIDVQGYELNVLTSCDDLSLYFKYIYVELSFLELYDSQPLFYDVYNFLTTQKYRLLDIKNLFYSNSGSLVQGDFLFERT